MAGRSRVALGTAVAVVGAAVLAATVAPALAGSDEIRVVIDRGRVTLSVTDAPLAEVLTAWAHTGGTRFIGAEPLGNDRITLHLIDAPEADAIRLLLRTAAGYIAAPRRDRAAGASRFDRVTVLAARRTPAVQTLRAETPIGNRRTVEPTPTPSGGAAPPALMAMEELQRLLDAAASASGEETGAEPPAAPPVRMTTAPGVDALPARPPRGRRP